MKKTNCGKCGFQRGNICRNSRSERSDTPVNKTTAPCEQFKEIGK